MTDFTLPGYKQPNWHGKVRDIYVPPESEGNQILGIVTTDRVSAFDNVVGEIPGIGILRNTFTEVWKKKLSEIVPNDLISTDLTYFTRCMPCGIEFQKYKGRVAVVRRLKGVPVESIVRRGIAGSMWDFYSKSGRAEGEYWGVHLPAGLVESQLLPEPIFTPTTKALAGEKDKPLTYEEMIEHIDQWIQADLALRAAGYDAAWVAEMVRSKTLEIFRVMYAYAYQKGILLADLKLEFGLPLDSIKSGIILMDEISPDCFRAWPIRKYVPGKPQVSLDKQTIRNYIKEHPGQKIPESVIQQTYNDYEHITTLLAA